MSEGRRAPLFHLEGRPFAGKKWWTGLDSNQRTLARADLQSAAFNHSATSPRGRSGRFSAGHLRQARQMAARVRRVNAADGQELSPLRYATGAPNLNSPPDCQNLERVKGIEPSS